MRRSFATLTLISLLFTACGAWATWGVFHNDNLPFSLEVVDAHTALIRPNPGSPLPAGIQTGDAVDLSALDSTARSAVTIYDMQGSLPPARTYQFVVRHGGTEAVVPVTTVPSGLSQRGLLSNWIFLLNYLLMSFLGLLVLWRGRDRAAYLMAAWLAITLIGFSFNYGYPLDGTPGVLMPSLAICCYVATRITFYLMIETLVGAALRPRARLIARVTLALVIAVGVSTLLGGHLLYYLSGWAGLMRPVVGIAFSAGYVVPTLVLLFSYGRAAEAQKPQLRWLLLSLTCLLVSVFVSNSQVLDLITSQAVQSVSIAVGISGFAYAILRHRVVDVRVVLDHTLVYGATTALVVGIVAALNSLALRATLGENTGVLLQIVIPLALGIVLGKVRAGMDRAVERVFFRRKYLAEKALRAFARQAGHMEIPARLLDATVREIERHMRAPAVAIYSAEAGSYQCLRQAGDSKLPKALDLDDAALVALRTERAPVELFDVTSALGSDGCVFPMVVLGNLRGALVCRNRPGEHYALDERQLLTQVAGEVGAALRILRARDNEAIVAELAAGKVPTRTLRQRAKAMAFTPRAARAAV